jgi:hypothetical protein
LANENSAIAYDFLRCHWIKLLMNDHPETDLENLIHRELRRLPGWKAPTTLAPRVIAAIQAQANRAWWQQPFWAWPGLVQVGFFGLLLVIVGVFARFGWWLGKIMTSETWPRPVQHFIELAGSLWDGLTTLVNAFSLVMHSGLQPWLWGLAGLSVIMYLSCVGVGTVFLRFAWKKI